MATQENHFHTGHEVTWGDFLSLENWLQTQSLQGWKQFFADNGYLVVNGLLLAEEIQPYKDIYDKMLSGQIDTRSHRHDLGNHLPRKTSSENVCQIMWPQLYVKDLNSGPLHERTKAVAIHILGDDMMLDFDMMIYMAPYTDTETPMHQDESYWPDLPDKRAVSCWVALDEATVENGCMWFVPGSDKQGIRKHRPVIEGLHVLTCDTLPPNWFIFHEYITQTEGKAAPLMAGSCTFHHGRTLHHTKGNSTATHRRAFITNYRPKAMIDLERKMKFDYGKSGLSSVLGKGQCHESSSGQ